MGMMDMAPMPQEAPQGMMGGQPQQPSSPTLSHGKFNGTVTVEGQPFEVKDGVVTLEGKPFMVSDDGKMVVNHEGQLVAHIENGELMAADEAYLKQMQQAGYVQ